MEEQLILKTLSELQSLIYSSTITKSLQRVKNKDIVLFMGNTRAGKSTVVNHVIGNPLKSEHVTKKRYRINHMSTKYTGPTIGVESTSETTLPTVWTSTRITGLIVDAPGFDDNRGEAQDIANVYHIRNILTSARSAKIVLVLDINDITGDNVGQFISLVDKVKSMFPNVGQNLNPAITFVLTKDNNDTTKSEVCEYFNKKILSQPLLKVNNRELVKYLSKNPKQIVLIRMPDSERNLNTDDEVFDDLTGTVENVALSSNNSYFKNVNFGLSDKSKAFLYAAHTRLTEHQDFENAFNTSVAMFAQDLSQYDKAFNDINHGNNIKHNLQGLDGTIQRKIDKNMNVRESLQAMKEIIPGKTAFNDEIYKKVSFVTFVDEILGINDSEALKARVKTALSNMKSQVIQKISSVQERVQQLQNEEQERKRKAEEERIRIENEELERLRRIHEEQQRILSQMNQRVCGGRRDDCTIM